MAVQSWSLILYSIVTFVTYSQGLQFFMDITPDSDYCGRLRCSFDKRSATNNKLIIIGLAVYKQAQLNNSIKLASLSVFGPDICLRESEINEVNVTGNISLSHAELSLDLRNQSYCLTGSFLCELEFVNASSQPDVIRRSISPWSRGSCHNTEKESDTFKMKEQFVELQKENVQLQNSVVELENYTAKLKKEYVELEKQNTEHEKHIAELKRENVQVEKEFFEFENDTVKLVKQVVEHVIENARLEKQNVEIENSTVTLEKQVAELSKEILGLKKEVEEMTQENTTLMSEVPTLQEILNTSTIQLHLIALDKPMAGAMRGIRGADYECHRQARRSGLKGTYRAFLSSHAQNLSSIIYYSRDKQIPIVNAKNQVLFNSWHEITNGSGAYLNNGASIYSFDGRDVMTNGMWPQKIIWHGSNGKGDVFDNKFCNKWHSGLADSMGQASSLLKHKLLDQEEYTCNNAFIVLCIENSASHR